MVSDSAWKWRAACVTLLSLGLAACGGGGGEGGGGSDGALLAELKEDVLPAGARVDVSSQNFFPMAAGDQWTYQRYSSDGWANGTVTDIAVSGANGRVSLNSYDSYTQKSSTSVYAVKSEGLVSYDPLGAEYVLPGLFAALPQSLEYPTPLYPERGERRIVRQGNLGADVDGDNKNDYYRVEISQVFQGFEKIRVLGRDMQVAHFTNSAVFTLRITTVPTGVRRTTYVEEAYFASGIGLVKADRSEYLNAGPPSEAPYSIVLTSAKVGGVSFTDSGGGAPSDSQGSGGSGGQPSTPSSGDPNLVSLVHSDLVYDAQRERYYASIPSSVVGQANRIATIDASTGTVSLSASAVGSNPGPMAISADGSTLYVGLSGSGELLRLSLPGLVETGRVALPSDGFFGQMTAEDISVSPLNPNVVAVSLSYSGSSPRHAGVALVRDMVVQPTRTQGHTGSNRIAFDSGGGWVLGYNNETTEFGLRRLEVLADGLIQREVVATNGGFGVDIDLSGDLVMVGGLAYGANTLASRGTVNSQISCVRLRNMGKVACVSWLERMLSVADTSSFGLQAQWSYSGFTDYPGPRLVAGPSGQVALFNGKEIRRITDAALR